MAQNLRQPKLWDDVSRINELAARLQACASVSRHGSEEGPTIAHALADIEESMLVFLTEQLPRLTGANGNCEEMEDVLMDIHEEFRHIAYHFHDPRYFRTIEPTHTWLRVEDYEEK